MSLGPSSRLLSAWRCAAIFAGIATLAVAAFAQYPGKVAKSDSKAPVLRSIAVLEWIGEPGKPSASRLMPVSVFDGEQLNDGTIYLTRPQPVALASDVEYELQTAGKPIGVFDVYGATDVEGIWQGVGTWKPLTAPQAEKAASSFNTSNLYGGVNAGDDDKPVLKRKHPKDSDDSSTTDASAKPETKSSTTPDASDPKATDPDRPTLTRKSGDDSAPSGTSSGSGSGSASASDDPDRPTMKRKSGGDSGSSSGSGSSDTASSDPDRPTLHRSRHAQDSDTASSSNVAPDPDRPRLKHGKSDDAASKEIPRLTGFPAKMQQAVAVSDAANHPDHPWKYTWANPDDEARMKGLLEDIARTELGLNAPPPPAKKITKTPASQTTAKKKVSMLPSKQPLPAELTDERFHVFELAYGATATLVLTASTPKPPAAEVAPDPQDSGPPVIKRGKPTSNTAAPAQPAPKPAPKPAPQKFVTLIAQPDLYGGILVLFKSTTDSAHLDETPRMTLVDAVDAMADNRGELLFDLRTKTQRQFALYRVLRGSAEQMFATLSQQ